MHLAFFAVYTSWRGSCRDGKQAAFNTAAGVPPSLPTLKVLPAWKAGLTRHKGAHLALIIPPAAEVVTILNTFIICKIHHFTLHFGHRELH